MLRQILALTFVFASSFVIADGAQAAELEEVQQRIADQMDGLLSDTVNEGDGSAYVQANGDKPAVDCSVKPSKSEASKTGYFCTVLFDVTVSSESEEETRSCFLVYSVVDGDIDTLSGKHDLETSCIENLASGD